MTIYYNKSYATGKYFFIVRLNVGIYTLNQERLPFKAIIFTLSFRHIRISSFQAIINWNLGNYYFGGLIACNCNYRKPEKLRTKLSGKKKSKY